MGGAVHRGSTKRGRGWGQPLLLCVVMAASELMGARVFGRQGPFAAWRRADALCVGVCVRRALFFFVFVLSLCFFSFLVSSSFFFRLLRFFLSCFFFVQFFSGFPLLGGFYPSFFVVSPVLRSPSFSQSVCRG